MPSKSRAYGEEFTDLSSVRIERADHIVGCKVELDSKGQPDLVAVQYRTVTGDYELRMDFAQALFVLSCLKSIQLDCRVPFPDDPRADRDNPLR